MFHESKNKLYLLAIPVFFIFIILSGSRAALLFITAGVLGLMFILAKHKTKYIYLAIGCVSIFFVVNWLINDPDMYEIIGKRLIGLINFMQGSESIDGSTRERLYYMEVAQMLFEEKPLFGVGLKNFEYYLTTINYSHIAYSHCNPLELLSCLGIIGFLLYYGIYFLSFIKLFVCFNKKDDYKFILLLLLLIFVIGFITMQYFDVITNIIVIVLLIPLYKFDGGSMEKKA